ncbi:MULTISPECIES: hypothetical protein [unclassified Desulfurobacterium]|uniref:hypothetical protein n=1 Tax=Desulfurobacterium sp. TC5-1 TaxID=1158318 RepID=UPI0003B3F963|nr:hypothetical protein [Desulfurobacterium sp. TC5-1]
MELLTWTPMAFYKKRFPRNKEGKPFISANAFKEAFTSAVIYYYIKKDREIEQRVKNYLLKKGLKPEEVVDKIKNIIAEKYSLLQEIELPEKIFINEADLYETRISVFDLKKREDTGHFEIEVFKGRTKVPVKVSHPEKLKSACHSYCEALANIEKKMLKDHPLAENFYLPLSDSIKKWEIPLRMGMWTDLRFKGYLLFFWRIKEVREKLFRELKTDIRPSKIIYLPEEKATAGWCELSI